MERTEIVRKCMLNGILTALEKHQSESNMWLEIGVYNDNEEPVENYMVEDSYHLRDGWDLNCYFGKAKYLDSVWDEFYEDICKWYKKKGKK